MKEYANAIIAVVVLILAAAVAGGIWYHGEQRFKAGEDKVQAEWNKDKADRKAAADKQAADTLIKNNGNKDALIKSQADLRDARGNLNAALERLRVAKAVPWGEGMFVAGGGSTEAPVPGVAGDTRKPGIRVEQRIGGCEDYGTDPCFVGRSFFEQSLKDAIDRGLTRQWAAGQGIKTAESRK